MSETLLISVTADVMFYEDSAKQWFRPGDNGSLATISNCGTPDLQKLSNVQLWQGNNKALFRITAKRIYDGKLLIEQTIFQKLKYQAATKSFHQWRSENRQVFGLSFSSELEAEKFLLMVQQAMEYVTSLADYNYSALNGSNNGTINSSHYQEIYYQQQQQQSNKEPDQDSIGSASGVSGNIVNNINNPYRKSSYSVNVLNSMNTMPGVASNNIVQQQYSQYQTQQTNIQRRASQGSNNSASTNSSNITNGANGIYVQTNGSNGNQNHNVANISRLNINNSNSQIVQNNAQNVTLTETASSTSTVSSVSAPPLAQPLPTGVPPVSNNVPPPPPPPPPMLKGGPGQKSLSFADQLKQTQLRNINSNGLLPNNVNRTSSSSGDTGIGSKTSTINSTNSGHSDLLSELAATINKRKKANTNSSNFSNNTDAVEKKSNVDSPAVFRPWQRTNNTTIIQNNNNIPIDSPRVHRKAESGSSLSSQEDSNLKNGGNNGLVSSVSANNVVTLSDLERFKQEIILELNKTKQEILNAMRQEFSQYFQHK